ncbi:urease accessory protein UreD [Thiothrix fructosivorans]|uniref:Urease accessory protein UreD n=1 Tax=Thiothrix fructosivorans TaxID=111770 RepID=A0A8B0SRY1_9GAMM|nr:urease accessory protein UreD [Thiothrix fructosivorans]MBO0612894.1 urease accessory protein UreD [Thiothrix fructosivorans]QTX11652.1 urease accessory protein UreD [Thiothrix fructosivorans]
MTITTTTQGWQAKLQLGFEQRSTKTVLASRSQRGPLAVQRPFYPEGDVCHAYVLHPPGGVVGGDCLQMDFQVDPAAHALLTTPGATKFYRSAGLQAQQHQHFHVTQGCLEWLPQENIFFPGANTALHSAIHLDATAQYIGWEIHCLGRPVIGETFAQGRALFRTALYRDGKPLLLDRLLIADETALHTAAGLRGQPVMATLLATPATPELLEAVRPHCQDIANGSAGVTLFNGVLVVRYLGNSTAQAQRLFRQLWQIIRPLVTGRSATPPRIWNT